MLAGEKLIDGLKSLINGRTLLNFLGDETGFNSVFMIVFNYFLLIFTNVLQRKSMTYILTLCNRVTAQYRHLTHHFTLFQVHGKMVTSHHFKIK